MTSRPEPRRAAAGATDAGKSCPYCRFPLKEGAEFVQCGVCNAGHHADCWADNGNGCAVVACAGGPTEETRQLPTQPAAPAATGDASASWASSSQAPQGPAPEPVSHVGAWQGATGRRPRGSGSWLVAAVLILALAVAGGAVAVVRSQKTAAAPAAETVTTGDTEASEADARPTEDTSSDATDADTDTETATAAPTSTGLLPDESDDEMSIDIADMLREHHQDIVNGDFRGAWDLYTSRKRAQKTAEEGYDAWRKSQATLSPYLDPSGLRVSIQTINRDTGEVRVDVNGMGWSKPGATCSEWSGVTWVTYEDGAWRYEPGYSTTPERRSAWRNRFSDLLGGSCSSG